jgi:hypothetical protein
MRGPGTLIQIEDDEMLKAYPYATLFASEIFHLENGLYIAVIPGDTGCVKVRVDVEHGDNPEERLNIFKKILFDFLKFYRLQTYGEMPDDGFKTYCGTIMPNEQFKIDADFNLLSLLSENHLTNRRSLISYYIHFLNTNLMSSEFLDSQYLSLYDRLKLYAKTRLANRNASGYRWAYREGDFQFSASYSGIEIAVMPISINGHPVEFQIMSFAKRASNVNALSDYLFIEMAIEHDDQLTNPDYNTVYGYWVGAKESARSK